MQKLRTLGFVACIFAPPVLAQVPPASIPPLPTVPTSDTPLPAAWTQFANEPTRPSSPMHASAAGMIQARFVLFGNHSNCDAVTVAGDAANGPQVPAKLRGHLQGVDPATDKGFTVTICTAKVPETWTEVRLTHTGAGLLTVYPSGQDAILPGPAAMETDAPLSGIVTADTGCRGKYSGGPSRFYQDCATDWPFPQIIRDAVERNPDFVLHAGDYHYYFEDETGFWSKDNGRDRFEYWLQEFLVPAHPLLMTAPWVLGRGNHERCQDHRWFGEGWHVLFSNMSLHGTDSSGNRVALRPCYDTDPSGTNWVAPAWAVDLGTQSVSGIAPWRVVVIDSDQPAGAASGFTEAAALTRAHGRNALWLSHYPPAKMVYYNPKPDFGNSTIKADAAAAMECEAPAYACRPNLIFAGHQHLFQEITWTDPNSAKSMPRIIIVGNSGTKLDANGLPGYARGTAANASITCHQKFPDTPSFGFGAGQRALLRTASQYGYMHIKRDAAEVLGWTMTPIWIGAAPVFPNAKGVQCDGTPVQR